MTARYLLCPGLAVSHTVGSRHYVGADQLAALHGVRMSDCLVMPPQRPANQRERMALLERVRSGELIALVPSFNGKYRLREAER